MSNEVNNLAASFVAMAQAFEELPKIREQLNHAEHIAEERSEVIQTLQLRIIDYKNQLDEAHALTRKAEVERDHAETMFLETDGKLDAAKSVLSTLMGNADAFLRAVEPPKPEPVAPVEPTPTFEHHEQEIDQIAAKVDPTPPSTYVQSPFSYDRDGPQASEAPHSVDPTSAPSWATPSSSQSSAPDVGGASGESVASSTTGESATTPTEPSSTNDGGLNTGPSSIEGYEGVSVPSDPTPATESSFESVSPGLTQSEAQPEPEPRYTPEWYLWADSTDYWHKRQAAQ